MSGGRGTAKEGNPVRLRVAVADALALIESRPSPDAGRPAPVPALPLPSLLERCEALARMAEPPRASVATLHHFACTGGTLIARLLGVMPNVVLLNEIDPLSSFDLPARMTQFAPTDTILAMRRSLRAADDAAVREVFLAGMEALAARARRRGQTLLLRDHPHSQFCAGSAPEPRPTLRATMAGAMPVASLVTVRHPLASFLSLGESGWIHFRPGTLEEYAGRYHAFLDAHDGVPTMHYEDLLDDPEPWLSQACDRLGLGYRRDAESLIAVLRTSGDSGRSDGRGGDGAGIARRPPRPVPPDLSGDLAGPDYRRLCARMDYDPDALPGAGGAR